MTDSSFRNEEEDENTDFAEDSRNNRGAGANNLDAKTRKVENNQHDEEVVVSDDEDAEVESNPDPGPQDDDEQEMSAEATPPQKQAHKPKFEPIRATVNDDDEDREEKQNAGSYSPSNYAHLDVSAEVKDLFKYITRYQPSTAELETKLKAFIPDYIPTVGEVDAFLKPARPDDQVEGLGLLTIDEPVLNQTKEHTLMAQLRAQGKVVSGAKQVVSSIENAEKNPKEITNWIKGVTGIARHAPTVGYSKQFPDIDTLMQVWPAEIEDALQNLKLPTEDLDLTLEEFSRLCCGLVDIPVHNTSKNLIESLHVYFTLYAEFRANQHFQQNEQNEQFVYEG